MEEPVMAGKMPAVLELEAGSYWWCKCGKSASQPFCDGSHKGGSFSPVEFKLAEKKRIALCNCKKTNTAPNCDGTHAKL